MTRRILTIALLAACGGKSDSGGGSGSQGAEASCRDAAAKVAAITKNPKASDSVVEACTKEEWSPEIRACFAAAAMELDLVDCQDKTRKTDRAKAMGKLQKNEAQLNLEKLRAVAKEAYMRTGKYPEVTASLTPETDCCKFPRGRCRPAAAAWDVPVWQTLKFSIATHHRFRYSFEGTATSFVAKAIGDLDCDGTAITYEVRGTVRDGAPHFELVDPPPHAD